MPFSGRRSAANWRGVKYWRQVLQTFGQVTLKSLT